MKCIHSSTCMDFLFPRCPLQTLQDFVLALAVMSTAQFRYKAGNNCHSVATTVMKWARICDPRKYGSLLHLSMKVPCSPRPGP